MKKLTASAAISLTFAFPLSVIASPFEPQYESTCPEAFPVMGYIEGEGAVCNTAGMNWIEFLLPDRTEVRIAAFATDKISTINRLNWKLGNLIE